MNSQEAMREMGDDLRIGTRIYYTGDMANNESAGTIIAVNEPTKYAGASVDIDLDDEPDRVMRGISALGFMPGPGRRFRILDEYLAEQRDKMAAFVKSANRKETLKG